MAKTAKPVVSGVLAKKSNLDNIRAFGSSKSTSGNLYPSGGVIGIFNPEDRTIEILSSPGNPSIVGKTMTVGSTATYMERAQKFAQSKSKGGANVNVLDATAQMEKSASSARLRNKGDAPSPPMYFYLPSAWPDAKDPGLLRVNMTPISCSAVEHDNAKSPSCGAMIAHVDMVSFRRDAGQNSNGSYDRVMYVFTDTKAPVHQGSFKDEAFLAAIAAEIEKPRKTTKGSRSFKYCLHLPGPGGMRALPGVVLGWDSEKKAPMTSLDDYKSAICNAVISKLAVGDNLARREEIANWVENEAVFSLQAGESNSEFFDDKSANANDSNRRFLSGLESSCATIDPYKDGQSIVRQPLKNLRDENGEMEYSRHRFTFRSLCVQFEPGGEPLFVSSGESLMTFKEGGGKNIYGYLSAVQLPSDPDKLQPHFSMHNGDEYLYFPRNEVIYDLALSLAQEADPAARINLIVAAMDNPTEEVAAAEVEAKVLPEEQTEQEKANEAEASMMDDPSADEVPF